jgi:hypothetical protein
MRRTPGRAFQTVVGLLIGLILWSPAQAIPTEVVSDTSATSIKGLIESTKQTIAQAKIISSSEMSRLEQLREHAENARRWIETTNHFTREIFEDVRRFTSLKGILGVVEERLGMDDDTLKALSDIGQTVRACYAIKEQFETLVQTRLRMIENLYKRAKAGIFNPAQDLADLDEYLRSGIGRNAEQVIRSRERLAALDNELETWIYQLQQARKDLAAKQAELNGIVEKLKAEGSLSNTVEKKQVADTGEVAQPRLKYRENQSAEAIAALWTNKNLLEVQINSLTKQVNDLLEKINARYQLYHLKFDERKAKASEIRRTLDGWETFIGAKSEAIRALVDPYNAAAEGAGEGGTDNANK